MTYQLYLAGIESGSPNAVTTMGQNPQKSFIFSIENPDYMAFKQALTTGTNQDGTPVQLEDATGTVMTSTQIATFLATLP
jgi:hypothetical protein